MPRLNIALPLLSIAALAGCATLPNSRDAATRLDTSPLVFQNRSQDAAYLAEQADTLTLMARDLRQKSMLRGAAIGGVVGCGIGVLTTGPERCLVGAAAGGLVGAVSGNEAGKRDVTRRMDAATPENLLRSLRTTQDHVHQMKKTLPHVLAAQDAALAKLRSQRETNKISQADYAGGIAKIRQSRAAIAEALTMSGKEMQASRANLQNAVDRGETGLSDHLTVTKTLEQDVYSARSGITLL